MLASWSLDLLIGVPIAAGFFILFVAIAVYAFTWWIKNKQDWDAGMALFIAGLTTFAALCTVGITSCALYPYEKEYHYWTKNSGVVAQIDKRIAEGIEEKFVVRYEDGRERGCLDTRCAAVKPGDTLTLSCKRVWQYEGTDGYDCVYVRNDRA